MSGLIEGFKPKAKKRKQESQESEFKVYINEGEMERILEWVKLKPDIETGGDLFGLWLDDHTAVVQFVLGPGENCHRTTTSFFQDISYLGDAGSYLTEKQGLCNIGQWHSHHKIPLFEPSAGDCNFVWSNMPKSGMERYIVFIANITHSDVTVNCFLFEMKDGQQRPVVKGCFYELQGESPLRLNKAVMEIVSNGAEILSKKDQMSDLPDEHSEQNETKTALIIKGDNGTPGEKEMRGTRSVRDKDPSENTTESKEVVNGKRRENNDKTSDNISSQNNSDKNSSDNNNKTASKKPSTVITTESTSNNTATNNTATNNDNSNNNDNNDERVSAKASTVTAVSTTNITSQNNNDDSINDNNYKTASAKASIVTAKGTNNISSQNSSNSRINNVKNGSNNNSNKENILNKNSISENIRISKKNNTNEKNNDNNENFNGENSNTDNKNNNTNTTSTTIATTTTNNDESARGQQPQKLGKGTKMKGIQRADGSFCFQTPFSQQNDLKDDLSNKSETMPTPSNEKQQNDPIPHDTTVKKPRCPSQYDNVETTPQTDEKTHEIDSEQERVIQEQPKPQNVELVNASSEHIKLSNEISDRHHDPSTGIWGRLCGRLWRHLRCSS